MNTAIGRVVFAILGSDAYRATKYISPTEVIKATRRHKRNKRAKRVEMVVTVGDPNYAEREFIKRCRQAGEPFPVKKIQLKFAKKK